MEKVKRSGTNILDSLEMECFTEMEHITSVMEAGEKKKITDEKLQRLSF